MKKSLLAISGVLVTAGIITACTSPGETKAGKDEAPNSYLETVEEYNGFSAIEFVHEPTGCHYLIADSNGSYPLSIVQMMGPDGKPYCN
jgi:predicted small secreted protein